MCKIIFNDRLPPSIDLANAIPIEVIGERRSQAVTYLALDKKLIFNIVNIRKLPAITICADTTNYYNRVVHSFTSLYTQYFWTETTYLAILFRAIYSMKIFLQIAYEVSESYYSSNKGILF